MQARRFLAAARAVVDHKISALTWAGDQILVTLSGLLLTMPEAVDQGLAWIPIQAPRQLASGYMWQLPGTAIH